MALRARKWLRKLHLWLGLTVGLWFALAGITGSMLVFYPRIDAWLNPTPVSAGRPASFERIYAFLRERHPKRSAQWRIEIGDNGAPLQARSLSDSDRAGTTFAPLIVWIDPTGPRELREAQWGHYAMTWIYDLHYRLLLGPIGATLSGLLGLFILTLLFTGLANWWPRHVAGLGKALAFRRNAHPIRRLYDIHKLCGLAALVVAVPIVATGTAMNLPTQTSALLNAIWPPAATSLAAPPAPPRGPRLTIDEVLRIAQARLPDGQLKWIEIPAEDAAPYAFRFAVPEDPNARFPVSVVKVDPRSGQIVAVRQSGQDNAVDRIQSWLHPLHNGEAFGIMGRLIVLFTGLLPLSLVVTGILRWRRISTGAYERRHGPNQRQTRHR